MPNNDDSILNLGFRKGANDRAAAGLPYGPDSEKPSTAPEPPTSLNSDEERQVWQDGYLMGYQIGAADSEVSDCLGPMIHEDNDTKEKKDVTSLEELEELLSQRNMAGTDFSLGTDKDHYVQVFPGAEDGEFYVGYKDAKGYEGFTVTEPCTEEVAREYVIKYFRGDPDWKEGFEWTGITTGPVWGVYAFVSVGAAIVSTAIRFDDGKGPALNVLMAASGILAATALIMRHKWWGALFALAFIAAITCRLLL